MAGLTDADLHRIALDIVDAADEYDSEIGGFINQVTLLEVLRRRLPEVYRAGFEAGVAAGRLPCA